MSPKTKNVDWAVETPDPSPVSPVRHLPERASQLPTVFLAGEPLQAPRQRGLGAQAFGFGGLLRFPDRPVLPAARDGEPEEGIVAEQIHVGLVRPALALEQHQGAEQLLGGMRDPGRIPGVVEPLAQPPIEPQAVEDLSEQEGSAVGAETLPASLDTDGTVEFRLEESILRLTHRMAPGGTCIARSWTPSTYSDSGGCAMWVFPSALIVPPAPS
jgi:hypothetical protein